MEHTDKIQWEVKEPLTKDVYKINAQMQDLEAFTELLNNAFAAFVKKGYIEPKNITKAIVDAVSQFDAAPLIAYVDAAYNEEANRIKYNRAKQDFLKYKEDAENDIDATIQSLQSEYVKQALKFYRPKEGCIWRSRYLQVNNGFVSYDRALLIEDNTDRVRSEQHKEFLEKAKALYKEVLSFNEDCKRLSGGAITGVSYAMKGDAIITINEFGCLDFDASLTSKMNFDATETRI